ncbi:hypothetical protein HPB49_021538 [Dermacentor silvarum]|uniref:Uncharacterized protein n=1 Tax=Dermacentor silvarum TaxID=543639 RepID=A0ACB8E3A8_DERSI|nr:hypothetical protein HPB49_021538 [Dermacentor silvarum]
MHVVELQPVKKPVFGEVTEYVIRKKLEEQQRAAETRASSKQQEALRGGDAMDGHVTTSTPGKTLQPKRWKPKVVPKFGTEDTVAVVKPRGTLNFSNFKGSNQIGEAMYAAAGFPSSSQALTFWPAWDQNIIIVGIRDAQFIRNVLAFESLRIGGRLQAVQVYLKMTDNTCRGVIEVDPKVSEADISEAIYSPDAPVVGVRKLGQSNAAAITFDTGERLCRCASIGRQHRLVPYVEQWDIGWICALIRGMIAAEPANRSPQREVRESGGSLAEGNPATSVKPEGRGRIRGLERKLRSRSRLHRRYQKRGLQRGPPGRDLREAVVQLTIIKLEEPELGPDQRKPRAASSYRTYVLAEVQPTKSRGEQQRNLKRALHGFAGMDEQLVAALTSKYTCTMKDNEPVREYEGEVREPGGSLAEGNPATSVKPEGPGRIRGLERKLRSRSRLHRRYQKRGLQRGPPGRDLREAVVQLTIIKPEEPELGPGQRKPRAAR